MIRRIVLTVIGAALATALAQAPPTLPAPTGPDRVGRDSWSWQDRNRPETITDTPDDYREVPVDVWYPRVGRDETVAAPYLPEFQRVRAVAGVAGLPNLFGPVWPQIESGQFRSHAAERYPIVPERKLPIVVFSPGAGTIPIAYTTQLEELASHGYVVFGVAHTYESPVAVFPDGRVITPANAYWARRRNDDPDAFEKAITNFLAADVRFVIDKVIEANDERRSPLFGKVDAARIGVFGHSRGGRVAARVCQLDKRVSACLNEDGNSFWQPFWLDESGASMQQPFMMIDHLDPELPSEAFSQMGTTREAYAANRAARRQEASEKIYNTIAGGSYHVTISTPGISHNSFSDVRLLGRPDSDGINLWSREVRATTPHAQILATIGAYTRAFFDKHVRKVPVPLLDDGPAPRDVEVRRFFPSRRPLER